MERIGVRLTVEESRNIQSLIASGLGPGEATHIVVSDRMPSTDGPDDDEDMPEQNDRHIDVSEPDKRVA